MKELLEQLDAKLNAGVEEYKALMKKFNGYTERELTLEEQAETKKILGEIYEKFLELYGVYHYIVSRYQFAVNETNKYNDFTDHIKKSQARAQDLQGQA